MKNSVLKKIISIAAAVSAILALTACGSQGTESDSQKEEAQKEELTAGADTVYRTLDEIKEDGTIHIGVFSDKNPFGYVDENGEYQGYDVYFANKIGEDLGVKVDFVSTEAANRIEYLQTGKVDIILARSEERRVGKECRL